MAKKSKRRFGVAYYHRGLQRFYVENTLTLDECKAKFRKLMKESVSNDEVTYVVAFESMKSFSVYDGWCDYIAKEV